MSSPTIHSIKIQVASYTEQSYQSSGGRNLASTSSKTTTVYMKTSEASSLKASASSERSPFATNLLIDYASLPEDDVADESRREQYCVLKALGTVACIALGFALGFVASQAKHPLINGHPF